MSLWDRLLASRSTLPVSSRPTDALTPDDDIPRYPPFLKGLPPASASRLLRDQQELLDRIRLSSGVGEAVWARWYDPVVHRYAAHVHLLPASQSHHHRAAGGLLRHGLEVAFQSLRLLDTVLIAGDKNASVRRALLPKWQYAAFLGGLLHDAAKPITDIGVTDRDGAHWSPFAGSLADWVASRDRYFLHWRAGRRDKHTLMGALICPRLIGEDALAWLAEDDIEVLTMLAESLTGVEYGTNKLRDIVTQADAWSVQKDVATFAAGQLADHDIGVPVERYILDTMRRLHHEGRLIVNRPGGHIWQVAGHMYLVWPKVGAEAIAALKQDRMPGIPSDPDRVAQLLIERGLAIPASESEPLHRLAPAAMADPSGRPVFVRVLQLRDSTLLVDLPPPDVEGVIETADIPDLRTPVSPVSLAPPLSSPASAVPPPRTTQPATAAPEVSVSTSDGRHAPPVSLQTCGPAGPILAALAEDIGKGVRPRSLFMPVIDGLALQYPDALTGYGIPPKDVLAALQQGPNESVYLVPDPITPAKRVRMLPWPEGEARGVVLRPDIAAWFQSAIADCQSPTKTLTPATALQPTKPDPLFALIQHGHGLPASKEKQGYLYIPYTEALAILQTAVSFDAEQATHYLAGLPSGQIQDIRYIKITHKKEAS